MTNLRPAKSRPRVPAVTLVELLAVIAIVLVLMALLVPLLWAVVGAVNSVRCGNRLRQIGIAYHRYMDESGGLWPPILSREPPPVGLFKRIEAETGLAMAPARPAANWGQPGPHWSIVLWPYLGSLEVYTCPSDPKAGLRGRDVLAPGCEHSVALLDAPPESYALNVILFRTADDLRRQAGCTWGTLDRRILFFCGASGQTVGSQFNIPFRTGGLVERWEWHPRRASQAFADELGCGSNYLFHGGNVEYRDELPGLWEWGYELGRAGERP